MVVQCASLVQDRLRGLTSMLASLYVVVRRLFARLRTPLKFLKSRRLSILWSEAYVAYLLVRIVMSSRGWPEGRELSVTVRRSGTGRVFAMNYWTKR